MDEPAAVALSKDESATVEEMQYWSDAESLEEMQWSDAESFDEENLPVALPNHITPDLHKGMMQWRSLGERIRRFHECVLVVAKGFGVSVPENCTPRKHVLRLESKLRDHFSSCGRIKSVCIPHAYHASTIKRFAYLEIWGEFAKERALQLSGTSIDGHELVVTEPLHPLKCTLKSAKTERYCRSEMMIVKGYDPFLSRKQVKSALSRIFSSCGEVLEVDLYPPKKKTRNTKYACVSIYGEGAEEKALQLSGCQRGRLELVVEKAYRPKPHQRRDIPIGLPPLAERLSDPNWREKYYSRLRLSNVEKKEEEETSK